MAMTSTLMLMLMLFLSLFLLSSDARLMMIQPQSQPLFQINSTQDNAASCSYTVTIKTSCSSPKYTRDQISLSFGDAYGYQVYAPRIDDPSTRAFERCSVDTYQVSGPCVYSVCYLYLYRTGQDGWLPETVQVYSSYTGYTTFKYNTYIPNGVWYGYNYCHRAIGSASSSIVSWLTTVSDLFVGSSTSSSSSSGGGVSSS
ncbi:embryo-specific protein ATS3A-like [Impatiens glandulifera]|uniref:embryo-specific protein ATS3A-like n=1 Tax=Impatiens glandulifera TaxID=253017 RepID=UPI001FB14B65|nr:embryo-specific protein ATS3A-like [Impatiens glandulifera]